MDDIKTMLARIYAEDDAAMAGQRMTKKEMVAARHERETRAQREKQARREQQYAPAYDDRFDRLERRINDLEQRTKQSFGRMVKMFDITAEHYGKLRRDLTKVEKSSAAHLAYLVEQEFAPVGKEIAAGELQKQIADLRLEIELVREAEKLERSSGNSSSNVLDLPYFTRRSDVA
jgi:hypothetical protein